MKSKNFIGWVGFVMLILTIALLTGCDSKSVRDDTTTSEDFQVTISASPSEVDLSSSVVVEVLVVDGSVPQADQEVRFQASPASAGHFSPDTAITDDNGLAATVFIPSSTGEAIITASTDIGLSTATNSCTITVTTSGSDDPSSNSGRISISANPRTLFADDHSSSAITLTVCDSSGHPVATPTTIKLVAGDRFDDANGDGIWSACCDSVLEDANNNGTWDPNGSIPATATTEGTTGTVTVNYTAGSVPGMVYIRASVSGTEIQAAAEFALELVPQGSNGSIGISLSDHVLLANGADTSVVTIAVADSTGQAAPDGTVLKLVAGDRFVDVDGDGYWSLCCDSLVEDINSDGDFNEVGTIPATVTVSGGAGQAVVNYISGTDSGIVYIRVSVDDNGLGAYREKPIHLTPTIKAGYVGISVSRAEVLANGSDTTIVTVAVCDADGNPAPDGTPVIIVAGECFYDSDGDGLWSQCCDSLIDDYNSNGGWDAIGSIAQTAIISGGTGEATAVYYGSTDSATVWIKATVNTVGIQGRADFPIQLLPPGPGSIEAYLSNDLLFANGVDTSILTIQAWDGFGMPVPESTLVVVTAGELFVDVDSNGYFSLGVDSVQFDANKNGRWDAIGMVKQYNYFLGDSGILHIPYVSGHIPTTVYMKITMVDPKIRSAIQIPLQLQADAMISAIYLLSDSMNLVVKSCGGIEIANMHAIGYDIHGNPVPEGVPIDFLITDGPGGGEHLDTVGYGPYSVLTNSLGEATVTLHSGTIPGTVRIRARANDTVLSNAALVMVSAGPPKYIATAAEFCNIGLWDYTGLKVDVVAVVSDTFHNPVNDSTLVYFSTDEGTMVSHQVRTEDLEGIAKTYWICGYPTVAEPMPDGKVWVIAETAGGLVKDSTMFYNTGGPELFTVSGMPDTVWADGVSITSVQVCGWDINGNPVVDGTVFDGDAKYLLVETGAFEYLCGDAACDRVKVYSQTLMADYSTPGGNDNAIGAIDTVSYWKFGAYYSHQVVLKTGYAYSGNSLVGGNFSVNLGETAYLNVTVKDRWSNPLGDHTLVASYPGTGVAGPGTKETNSYGEAYGFSWTPADTGSFMITITDSDPRGGLIWTKTISVGE